MSIIILLNKPYNVLCQFTDKDGRSNLSDYISIPDIYPAGRLDKDSEGLVVLTNNGRLQHQIANPRHKLWKTYWVQVDGKCYKNAVKKLCKGIELKDGLTKPAKVKLIAEPVNLWTRAPPVRYRANIPTSWLEITLQEGKNRQIRRMTAAVGFPTLRLIRHSIGSYTLDTLQPGEHRSEIR